LEKIPCNFKYTYICSASGCKGHTQIIIDWEIGQLYRHLRDKKETQDNIIKKIKDKFGGEIISPDRDVYFFVGSHSLYHESFMLLGVFWPAKISK